MLEAFASVITTAHALQGDGSGSGCQTKPWIWSNKTQTAFVRNDSEKSIRKPSQLPYESTNRSFLGSIFSFFFQNRLRKTSLPPRFCFFETNRLFFFQFFLSRKNHTFPKKISGCYHLYLISHNSTSFKNPRDIAIHRRW